MASVRLTIKGNKNPSTLYMRFVNGRKLDISCKTNLSINPKHWDNKKGNYRNISAINNLVKKQAQIERLKIHVLSAYNDSYSCGDIIDKGWLESTVSAFFRRPIQENKGSIEKHYVYYSQFCDWWIETKAPKWKTGKNKYLSDRMIGQYNAFVSVWKSFEGKTQYKIKNVNNELLEQFADWMIESDYAVSTTKRHISRAKFFLFRAEAESITTNPSFSNRVFVEKETQDVSEPYLNLDEINSIYNLDLSHDITLDNVRDNFIIGLWTGLRVSDFNKNLDVSNIDGEYIKIKTQKTATWVTIPLHTQVKEILNKRFGNLPVKTSNKFFNKKIKTICMLAEIDQEMYGGLVKVDKKTKQKRKVYGMYKKYQLISSHVARRSFCTNLFGKIPNHDLMKIAGWASESMMLHYVKKTKTESADNLKKYWNENY